MKIVDMDSIQIDNWNLDNEGGIFELHQLYTDILKTDNWWHFFREGECTLIRCKFDHTQEIIRYLLEVLHKGEDDINVTSPWVDNIKVTEAHQEEFMYIFHGFSELAMKILVDDKNVLLDSVLDRVVHCFMNMARDTDQFKDIMPFIPGESPDNISHAQTVWESMKLCHNAIMRSYTIGRWSGISETKRIIESTRTGDGQRKPRREGDE